MEEERQREKMNINNTEARSKRICQNIMNNMASIIRIRKKKKKKIFEILFASLSLTPCLHNKECYYLYNIFSSFHHIVHFLLLLI
jgi:hypothetical protein